MTAFLAQSRLDLVMHGLGEPGLQLARGPGDYAGIAEAILKRVELWPSDVGRLREASQEFSKLAKAVRKDRHNLTPAEETERQRYLDHSARLAREADLQTSRREK